MSELPDPTSTGRFKSERAARLAKRLRKEMNPAEKLLWSALRQADAHWRKQAPIGPFVADFVSHGAKLVVEADGGAHRAPDVAVRDLKRDQWLHARGYRVLRFANADIEHDLDRVVAQIDLEVRTAQLSRLVADTPSSNSSPQGGGEKRETL